MDASLFVHVLLVVGLVGVLAVVLLIARRNWSKRRIDEQTGMQSMHASDANSEPRGTRGDDLDDEIVAVITAAVEATMRQPITIRRIRFLEPSAGDESWTTTGRVNIMSSHIVPKR